MSKTIRKLAFKSIRRSWDINPIARVKESKKTYKRNKFKNFE
jgi:hypothetical protein